MDMVDVALLLIRLAVGLTLAAHGAQKLFGWFGGGGLHGTRQMMSNLNVHPSLFWAYVSGVNEFAGGLLTAFGFLMPLGPLMIIATMAMAIIKVHWGKGFWNMKGGYEYPLLLLVSALALGLAGPGALSVDALIRFAPPEPLTMLIGIAIILVGFGLAVFSGQMHQEKQKEMDERGRA